MSNRNVTRRKLIALAGAAGAAGLAGCSSGGTNGGTDGGESGGGSGTGTDSGGDSGSDGGGSASTATLWAWNDPGLSPIRDEQASELAQQSDAISDVSWEYYPFENYLAKATTAIPAGNAPDSLALSVLWVPRFADKGVALNLEEHGFDPDDYVSAARSNASYDDTLWAVPWYADCRLVAINTKMFEEAGLEVPDPTYRPSWEEFGSWVDTLAKEHGTGYSMSAGEGFDCFALSNGSGYLNEDGTEAIINNDAALEAANFLQPKVVEEESIIARNPGGTAAIEDLLAGESAMCFAGSWHYPRLRDSGLDWQYMPYPGGPQIEKSHTWSAGVFYSIPKRGGANQDIGLEWLNYINSMEVQKNVTKSMGGFPGRKDAYETDAFQSFIENNPKLKPVAQEMENTISFPSHPEVTKMWNTVHTQAQSMWQGEEPEKALDKAAKEINALL
ncbi:extracellular solute-binding protein [Halogeometricum limi]|uniref:Carbohydrate ABC transporter substrate-binding protein, CUT1 family (TC 3.A.1.1.-) n=1 Tax=Halogeometricum limi TaxID=555875 RepID=A0A1I6IBG5_9EURY|nr:extracellular solute-binding protein [Halogeometricum limi]SFR64082.1 carbohydrate ABC transporter substrate-binding protein, CUT1 family (TC 3.A.1.1.-) [Halogeometricum limi]